MSTCKYENAPDRGRSGALSLLLPSPHDRATRRRAPAAPAAKRLRGAIPREPLTVITPAHPRRRLVEMLETTLTVTAELLMLSSPHPVMPMTRTNQSMRNLMRNGHHRVVIRTLPQQRPRQTDRARRIAALTSAATRIVPSHRPTNQAMLTNQTNSDLVSFHLRHTARRGRNSHLGLLSLGVVDMHTVTRVLYACQHRC